MIYFIKEDGLFKNQIKIGYSDDPGTRIKQAQTWMPSKARLLLVLEGDKTTEAIYHELFEQYHIRGEWFKYGLWLRWFILRNKHQAVSFTNTANDNEGTPKKYVTCYLDDQPQVQLKQQLAKSQASSDAGSTKRVTCYLDDLGV